MRLFGNYLCNFFHYKYSYDNITEKDIKHLDIIGLLDPSHMIRITDLVIILFFLKTQRRAWCDLRRKGFTKFIQMNACPWRHKRGVLCYFTKLSTKLIHVKVVYEVNRLTKPKRFFEWVIYFNLNLHIYNHETSIIQALIQ